MTDKPSITTRGGDQGTAALYSGERLAKDDLHFEVVGTVDELVSYLGVARTWIEKDLTREAVLYVQRALFTFASETAVTREAVKKLTVRLDQKMMSALDARRDALENIVVLHNGFILPGEHRGSAHLDFARTIARRLERRTAALIGSGATDNPLLLPWVNRLSDYLYLLARYEEDKPRPVKEG